MESWNTLSMEHIEGSGPEWYISSMFLVEIHHSGLEPSILDSVCVWFFFVLFCFDCVTSGVGLNSTLNWLCFTICVVYNTIIVSWV